MPLLWHYGFCCFSENIMRICHVITRFVRGGADENTLLSCNAQAQIGHTVYLVCGDEVSDAMLKRLHPDIVVHRLPSLVRPIKPLADFKAFLAMVRLFRAVGFDIVHTHTSKAGILGRIAAKVAGIRGIIHGVHILPFLNVGKAQFLVYWGAEKLLAPMTHAFVDVSSGMLDACLEHKIGNSKNHIVVPSGMNIEKFIKAQPVDDSELVKYLPHIKEPLSELHIILMVAALEPRKRVVEFLYVFAEVVKTDSKAILVLLGEGHDKSRIEQTVKELGLESRVVMVGFRNDVERWIARANVCVLASEREGLPRVVVQYALGARPTVVTALPGVEVVVKHEKTGYLVHVDKVPEMSGFISQILANKDLAQSMIDEAKKLDLSAWSVDFMASELERIYNKVLLEQK